MNNALRDQLLKAGLITEDQAKSGESPSQRAQTRSKPKRAEEKRKRQHNGSRVSEQVPNARRSPSPAPNRAKVQVRDSSVKGLKSKSGNPAQTPSPYAHLDKAQRDAVRRFLRDQRVNKGDGETPYQFQEGSAVRKVWVTPEQRQGLMEGALVIVPRNDRYYVLEAAQADPLRALDPLVEIIYAQAQSDGGEEDPDYKDYPIPDDLMW